MGKELSPATIKENEKPQVKRGIGNREGRAPDWSPAGPAPLSSGTFQAFTATRLQLGGYLYKANPRKIFLLYKNYQNFIRLEAKQQPLDPIQRLFQWRSEINSVQLVSTRSKNHPSFLAWFFDHGFGTVFLTKPTAASKKQAENLTEKLKAGKSDPAFHTHLESFLLKKKTLGFISICLFKLNFFSNSLGEGHSQNFPSSGVRWGQAQIYFWARELKEFWDAGRSFIQALTSESSGQDTVVLCEALRSPYVCWLSIGNYSNKSGPLFFSSFCFNGISKQILEFPHLSKKGNLNHTGSFLWIPRAIP